MNLKRWLAWLCLALMLVVETLLFRANLQVVTAQTDLRMAQAELGRVEVELAALKNSEVGLQAAEISQLRRQNKILANRVDALQFSDAQLGVENQSNAQHLATARLALRLQQEHLQELQAANEQMADTNLLDAAVIARKTCLANLRLIDDAKQEWALENNRADEDVPVPADLLPYLKGGIFPVCPEGGTYFLNAVDEVPTCSIPGHELP